MSKKLVDTGGLCIYQFVGARRRQLIGIQVGSRQVTMTMDDFAAVLAQAAEGLALLSDPALAAVLPDPSKVNTTPQRQHGNPALSREHHATGF